jgi:hypothetical protein
MTRFSFDLPFFIPLDEGEYALKVNDQEITIRHAVMQQTDPDPRIGSLRGSFGFARDQLGVLRYSRLDFELADSELERLGTILSGDGRPNLGAADYEAKGRVALAICNQFLDKYRMATRKLDIKPIGAWDLTRLHFEDSRASGDLRLYGGAVTLAVAGLSPEDHVRVLNKLADPNSPAAYELAALDALRTVQDGQVLESIVTAIGALEASLDLYFARSWRLSTPRVLPQEAAAILGVNVRKSFRPFTVEDVLEKAGVKSKVTAYATAKTLDDEEREDLYEAIELRNLVVHGGVRVPVSKAKPHVETVARFVLDHLAGTIRREYPELPHPEILYACEEALGAGCSPQLQQLADTYLTARGLTARLFNHKSKPQQMVSERFGDTLVMRISFGDFPAEAVGLFIARALLHHSLEQSGVVAVARGADDQLEERRAFFRQVASELTRAVWGAAIDKRLLELGFEEAMRQDIERRADELRRLYGPSYTAPAFHELGHWVDYVRMASVAAVLPLPQRSGLFETSAAIAPEVTRRAIVATSALEDAAFDDPASIRDALIRVHDANESIMASATIYDPVTGEHHGRGLRFDDIFDILG